MPSDGAGSAPVHFSDVDAFLLHGVLHEIGNTLNHISLLSNASLPADEASRRLDAVRSIVEKSRYRLLAGLFRAGKIDEDASASAAEPRSAYGGKLTLPDDVDLVARVLRVGCRKRGVELRSHVAGTPCVVAVDPSAVASFFVDAGHACCALVGAGARLEVEWSPRPPENGLDALVDVLFPESFAGAVPEIVDALRRAAHKRGGRVDVYPDAAGDQETPRRAVLTVRFPAVDAGG